MSWSGSFEEEEWLAKSAVGVLKDFGNLESVNKKLEDRSFMYSLTYMGGKHIMWSFESSYERDGFLGSKVGEVLWIDVKTEFKKRLDCGRLLVLAPLEAHLSCEINVTMGNVSFPVKLVEHQIPTTDEWINKVLVLKPWFSNLKGDSDKEVFEMVSPFLGKKGSYEGVCRHDRGRASGTEKGVGKSNDMMDCRKAVREFSSSSKMERKEVSGDRGFSDKGKGRWSQRLKPTSKQPRVAGAVKIDKKRVYSTESSQEGLDSSDLGFSSDFGPGPNYMFHRGECSKKRSEKRKSASGPGDGPYMLDYNKVERIRSKWVFRDSKFYSGGVDNVGPTKKELKCGKKAGMENKADQSNGVAQFSDSYVRNSSSVQEVLETQFTNN
ncbi:hypothetical protein LWI29_015504 [Acer saccharum]|uniref:Uncharacterized protein n=1 Tax=Acer saccharum TaxID=4024 RepID=A0AA39VFK2_ACESA|nr:hypothetical protein LWI29_015504 [Acer saccharum]